MVSSDIVKPVYFEILYGYDNRESYHNTELWCRHIGGGVTYARNNYNKGDQTCVEGLSYLVPIIAGVACILIPSSKVNV